jgi:two-component system alkaline phosphatase synthesis response regulator PhoP
MDNNSYRVLVCEDDPAMVRIFQFLLQKQGIGPVLTATDGAKVVAIAQRERPHLILLDMMLPNKDGLTILKELKAIQSIAAIPVVVISGIESQNQVSQAIDTGAADYVTKPFDSMDLGMRLRSFLDSLYGSPATEPGTSVPSGEQA